MTKTQTLSQLATQTLKHYEHQIRDTKKGFWSTKDNAPSWISDMNHKAHGDTLPNDYVYEFIVDALHLISQCETEEQMQDRINEIEADVYNGQLLAWVSDNLTFAEYVNEAVKEFGIYNKDFDLYTVLAYGQKAHREEVAYSVLSSLKEQLG